MKSRWLIGIFPLLVFPANVMAQVRPGGGGGGAGSRLPGVGGASASTHEISPEPMSIFVSGKVGLDDGTELTEPAAIQMICRGERHTRAYTDRHGAFSFQLGDSTFATGADVSDASSNAMTRNTAARDVRNWRDCELQAALAGYSSELIELASRMNTLESTDVGKITLHRLEQVEGTSISVTSALAPGAAKKALEKGREEEKKGKLPQAETSLQKAVQIYPKYASAWFELGQVQMQRKNNDAAKRSFEQAITADPKYVNPYNGLAELAFDAKQWTQVVEITDRLLALNPVNFPSAYFMNAAANLDLNNLDAAEKNARQGIRIDDAHQVPRLYYLLGVILIQKHDYSHASEVLQQFIQMAKQPSDIESAKQKLAEIARLSAAAGPSASDVKK